MNNYTPEQLYNLYRHKIFLYTKSVHVNQVKNFEHIKLKSDWQYFEKFSKLVRDNAGNLNPDLYLDSLIDFYKGYFNLKLLSHLKGIKIYKLYIKHINSEGKVNVIYQYIKNDLKHIVQHIQTLHNKSLNYYLNENNEIFPTLAKHFNSGSISKYTLAIIPNIIIIIKSYPIDIQQQFFYEFLSEYKNIRQELLSYSKIRKINDNFNIIIEKMLLKSVKEV